MPDQRAKELFFTYIGSSFFMSRDGIEGEYRSFGVPAAVEQRWMNELTQQKLAALANVGNWSTVHFLTHHGNYAHLPELLAAAPSGVLWERCAFLEELLKHIKSSTAPLALRHAAAGKILSEGATLLGKCKAPNTKQRVTSLLAEARSFNENEHRGG